MSHNAGDEKMQQALDDLQHRVQTLERGRQCFWSSAATGLSIAAAMCWVCSAAGQKAGLTVAAFPVWAQPFNALAADANVWAAAVSGLAALAAGIGSSRG